MFLEDEAMLDPLVSRHQKRLGIRSNFARVKQFNRETANAFSVAVGMQAVHVKNSGRAGVFGAVVTADNRLGSQVLHNISVCTLGVGSRNASLIHTGVGLQIKQGRAL